jgi:hypothetical protein
MVSYNTLYIHISHQGSLYGRYVFYIICIEIQCWESHITSWTADVASKKQLMKLKTIDMATWSQNLCKGLQKFGRGVCLIPVRFRFVTPDAADPALISA